MPERHDVIRLGVARFAARRSSGAGVVLAIVLALTTATYRTAEAHPIHTTLTELTIEKHGEIRVRVRAFADDLSAAVARHSSTKQAKDYAIADSALSAYAKAMITLATPGARPVPLNWTAQWREGDVVWFELRSIRRDGALGGATFRNVMLFELYDDQMNIVQVSYAGKRHTTLFARGDAAKKLP